MNKRFYLVFLSLLLAMIHMPGTAHAELAAVDTPLLEENVHANTYYTLTSEAMHVTATPLAGDDFVPSATLATPYTDGLIVYTFDELRTAIEQGTDARIYLGYSDTNGGVIAYTDTRGIKIGRSVEIVGHDPQRNEQVLLRDAGGTATTSGMNVTRASVNVTLRDLRFEGTATYGMLYASGVTGVTVNLDNVTYSGPLAVHNRGTNAVTAVNGCNATVSSRFAEVGKLTLSGQTRLEKTSGTDALLVYGGTGAHALQVTADADVTAISSGCFVTDTASTLDVTIDGTLDLTTRGSAGGFTLSTGTQYVRTLTTAGTFLFQHESAQYPSIQARQIIARENAHVDIHRAAATAQPVLRLETSGTVQLENPALFRVTNTGGPVMRTRSGTATLRCRTQVINQGIQADDRPLHVICRAYLDVFENVYTFTTTGATTLTVNDISHDGKGDSRRRGTLNLNTAKRFLVGHSPLTLADVYEGTRVSTGVAKGGGILEVGEYRFETVGTEAIPILVQDAKTLKREGTHWTATFENPVTEPYNRVYAVQFDGIIEAHSCRIPYTVPLNISDAPPLIFEDACVTSREVTYGRKEPDWAIGVYDRRGYGYSFALQVTLGQPLTASGGETLPDCLIYAATPGATPTPLNGTALKVASVNTQDQQTSYSVTWPEDAGFLLRVPPNTGRTDETYTARIVWTLLSDG